MGDNSTTRSAEQEELGLFAIASEDENVRWLVGVLGDGEWHSSVNILMRGQKPITEYWRRWVRALAEASHGEVLSAPGTPGYKLTCKCTPEDLRCVESLKTQSDKMRQRYIEILNVWHRRAKIES